MASAAPALPLSDISMLDWPDAIQTSPTMTFLIAMVFLPLMVRVNGPPPFSFFLNDSATGALSKSSSRKLYRQLVS